MKLRDERRVRLPFSAVDALHHLERLRDLVVDDAAFHDGTCERKDCPDSALRLELVMLLDGLVCGHGGRSVLPGSGDLH
jgi:hypothetical protein